jgi:uncharacterized protein (TIGR02217 family)
VSNLVFPVLRSLQFPVTRSPYFQTNIQKAKSGREVRISEQAIPLRKWSMSFSALRQNKIQVGQTYNDFARLEGFFLQLGGAFDSFLFQAPEDFQLTDEDIGTGNGIALTYQITRNLGGYKESIYEIATSPVPVVKVNGVTKTVVTDYTINSSTGVITFVVAPPNTQHVTVTLQYYFRCRFTNDNIDLDLITSNLWQGETVEIEALKP